MRCIEFAVWLLVAQLSVSQEATSSSAESDLEESQVEGSNKQQGSWSQWWSYDGISGPDYWNINKQWRLCSLGRKQSPIEVRTERLVYDHLLGPLRFSWLPAQTTNYDDATLRKFASTRKSRQDQEKQPIRLRLLNSGRGIEAWLESGVGAAARTSSNSPPPSMSVGQQEQLILSRGPLSYAYKLYKIELHSAASASGGGGPTSAELAAGELGQTGSGSADLQEEEQQQQRGQQLQLLASSSRSSEHLIDGRAFDGEIQLHFYNRHLASSSSEAQQLAQEDSRPNLFAAISVFIMLEASPATTKRQQESGPAAGILDETRKSAIDFMLDNLNALQNQGDFIRLELSRDQIESLITSRSQYVTYQGSMNRPPCAETVDWILLNRALRVDRSKFEYLFERLNTNQENVRPVKALHRRLLRTTINNFNAGSKAALDEEEEDDDDDQKLNADEELNVSDIKLGRSSNGSHRFSSCSTMNKQNCSSKQEADGSSLSRLEEELSRRKGHSSCSMRPNYAYQLRYSKQQQQQQF